jgi:carboxypeptidase C (cathepsin A)
LLDQNVKIVLYSGDADYICNWFGGEAVSLAVNYTHAAEFRATGYAPFVVDGTEYGAVREKGNSDFVRIYESGDQVPYFQRRFTSPFPVWFLGI